MSIQDRRSFLKTTGAGLAGAADNGLRHPQTHPTEAPTMLKYAIRPLILLALLSMWTGVVAGSESDKLHRRIEVLKKKIAALTEHRRREVAHKLFDVARTLLEAADKKGLRSRRDVRPVDVEKERQDLRARLDELRAQAKKLAEAGDEAGLNRVERAIEETIALLDRLQDRDRDRERDFREREYPDKLSLENRLEHLLQAVEHLKAAGLHELAQRAAEHAEELEAAIRQSDERRVGAGIGPGEIRELHQAIRELREEVDQLRAEVRELRGRRRE